MSFVRVLIVDDHPLFAEALERVIQAAGWLQVVGWATNLREAEVLLKRQSPDVILLNPRLPDSEGVSTIQALRRYILGARLVVLTACESDLEPDARRLRVDAFLKREAAPIAIIETLAGLFPSRSARRAENPLTAREMEVARLAAEAFTNRQIAETLFISENTVKTHLARVLQKLGFSHRVELARRWNPRLQSGFGAERGPA